MATTDEAETTVGATDFECVADGQIRQETAPVASPGDDPPQDDPNSARSEAGSCVIGRRCREHGYVHGGEADELRGKVEDLAHCFDDDALCAFDGDEVALALQRVLDEVDARDSLAFCEAALNQPPAWPRQGAEVWGWSLSDDPESWDTGGPTREDAIAEGRAVAGGRHFYVVRGRFPRLRDAISPGTAELIVDNLRDDMGDACAAVTHEDWEPTREEERRLQEAVEVWADSLAVDFWTVVGDSECIDGDDPEEATS